MGRKVGRLIYKQPEIVFKKLGPFWSIIVIDDQRPIWNRLLVVVTAKQCDQIWRFIGLWATFKAFGNNQFAQIFHILGQFL